MSTRVGDHPRYSVGIRCPLAGCTYDRVLASDDSGSSSDVFKMHLVNDHDLDALIAWLVAHTEWRRTYRLIEEVAAEKVK